MPRARTLPPASSSSAPTSLSALVSAQRAASRVKCEMERTTRMGMRRTGGGQWDVRRNDESPRTRIMDARARDIRRKTIGGAQWVRRAGTRMETWMTGGSEMRYRDAAPRTVYYGVKISDSHQRLVPTPRHMTYRRQCLTFIHTIPLARFSRFADKTNHRRRVELQVDRPGRVWHFPRLARALDQRKTRHFYRFSKQACKAWKNRRWG